MAKVKVTFEFEPLDPDEDDPSGMAEDEYNKLMEDLGELGAENISINAVK